MIAVGKKAFKFLLHHRRKECDGTVVERDHGGAKLCSCRRGYRLDEVTIAGIVHILFLFFFEQVAVYHPILDRLPTSQAMSKVNNQPRGEDCNTEDVKYFFPPLI